MRYISGECRKQLTYPETGFWEVIIAPAGNSGRITGNPEANLLSDCFQIADNTPGTIPG
jgi:hypothetical protein